ncbi:MAG: DUF4339 domain-containing protein [Planctomycetes bacterium]|nr:DUF4339 domain-containing protein [Planctomycetota bacterium]MBU4397697.1 DUF4339 domain-containing protein [Planctomycetota bacterium]MCG2684864.1 DUF4339 domain-containing protein [Planctomycetales bacterium]
MGIRFYCPNGHKLNVKDFQAGRNGICPFCGAKMQIPLESTRPSFRRRQSQSQEGGCEAPAASEATVDEIGSPTVAAAAPSPDRTRTPSADSAPSAAASPAESADPLAEAGEVVWYVRPTSGGQFGPATADCMRTWLAEGRIAVETLVWHEGWRDWRDAGDVFPQLSRAASFPGLETILPELVAAPLHTRPAKHRTRDRTTQYIFIGGLTFAVLLLFAILLLVLSNQ